MRHYNKTYSQKEFWSIVGTGIITGYIFPNQFWISIIVIMIAVEAISFTKQ